jgi:hypothetical protein
MDGTCRKYGKMRVLTKFWRGNLKGRDYLGNLHVDRDIILNEP